MAGKSAQAFRTIGELATDLGVPQHILRYWETRFPQLKPLQRAGNRRYYRPDDVALARRIHRLLNEEGYTVRGVQRVLGEKAGHAPRDETASVALAPSVPVVVAPARPIDRVRPRLAGIRDDLAGALRDSEISVVRP